MTQAENSTPDLSDRAWTEYKPPPLLEGKYRSDFIWETTPEKLAALSGFSEAMGVRWISYDENRGVFVINLGTRPSWGVSPSSTDTLEIRP